MDAAAGGCQSRSPAAHLLINPAAHPPSPFSARLPRRLGCSFSSSSCRDRFFFLRGGVWGVCVCGAAHHLISPPCRSPRLSTPLRLISQGFREAVQEPNLHLGRPKSSLLLISFRNTLSNLTSLFGRRGPSLRVHVAVGAQMHF